MSSTSPALPLFAYGTLRDPDLLSAVLNRPLRPDGALHARAPGFRAVHYPNRVYPALIRAPGAAAEGLLLTDLSPFERDLLDAFEGEEYRREVIAAMIDVELHEAYAYLPTITVAATSPEWSLAAWQTSHKPQVLAAEAASAADIRTRLIAVRPH
ncbi:gamma-glutamylcyclotransferase family protein [Devosia sp.]|uniref:gamma-glutamylcyclotransferase family protein n=1 Tax=Devosia sp. TaxID=1871048 RepID=UPI003BA9795D